MPENSDLTDHKGKGLKKVIGYLGPGIITAALVFGPGSLTVISKIGAAYGYQLVWVPVMAAIFMMVFTGMAIRIGVATDQTLLTTIRDHWGKFLAYIIGIGVFLVTASFQAGNSIGVGIAFGELFETSFIPWASGFTLAGIILLSFPTFYRQLEKVMIVLVGIMLFSFIVTLIIVQPEIGKVAQGLLPSIPSGSIPLVVASVASSFSIVGAFYQSYLVQEKKWRREQAKIARGEGITGITILGVISTVVLICAGAVLHPKGITVQTASEMARVIEPTFGPLTSYLFMLGLFGASFSSLIGNATIGGSLLADTFGVKGNLRSPKVRYLIMLVMVIGLAVSIIFGTLPLELIVVAQGLTIFVVPLIGLSIFVIANKSSLLGNMINGKVSNILGILGIIILLILAGSNFYSIFLS